MVGIVVVSHSASLARGVAELARQMGGPEVVIAEAGGTDLPDAPLGTDAQRVMNAIEQAASPDGVLVLMDLGSAVLSAELAVELLDGGAAGPILLCEAPLVEGAVSAATAARLGRSLAEVAAEARGALGPKIAQLGIEAGVEAGGEAGVEAGVEADVDPGVEADPATADEGPAEQLTIVVPNPLGLHARPAARLVTSLGRFDADVELTNVTSGRGPASARSLNAVATIGARQGDEILVRARGPQATDALVALKALADDGFGDRAAPTPARPRPAPGTGTAPGTGSVLAGIAASPGVAVGAVRRARHDRSPGPAEAQPLGNTADEHAALAASVAATRTELAALRASVAARAGEEEAAIFDVHLLLLDDPDLLDPAHAAIERGLAASSAWQGAVDAAVGRFAALDDAYQRARGDDVAEVGRRVLAHLSGQGSTALRLDGPGVLVAPDLSPGEAASVDPGLLLGIATSGGGPLGHGAILARALGIPAVVGLGEAVLDLADGMLVAVDGSAGTLTVDPSPSAIAAIGEASTAPTPAVAPPASGPGRTADGCPVAVAANAGSAEEARRGVEAGAEGVGLLRTEFLFLGRVDLPSEDEQVDAYTDVARALGGLPLVIRTLDAGADKPLPALATGAAAGEENPALGVRGLRLGLAHPDVLSTQLRAIVRVAADHPVLVMFPMVSTVDEVRRAKALLNDAVLAVSSAGQPVPRDLPVGVMVEVPAAALAAGTLAPEVDFFSIGTNDLTQYTLAADRTNAGVASLADGLHPAVLRLVADVAQGAARSGRWVGVCGELASDPVAVPILVGLGVTELSVRPQAVAATRAAVAATDTASARALAEAALAATSAADVRRLSATGSSHVAHAMPAVPSRLLTGLTVARMVLAPIVVALVLAGRGARHAYAAGAVVFALAALTDLADGFLARRWGQTSTLGSVLDTAADKILVTAVLVALVSVGRASPWWASVIVGRELAVLALRAAVASAETTRERTVAPSWLGKLKANVEFAAITLAIVRPGTTWGPWHPDEWLLAAAGVLAVVSAVDYGARFLPAISGRGRRR